MQHGRISGDGDTNNSRKCNNWVSCPPSGLPSLALLLLVMACPKDRGIGLANFERRTCAVRRESIWKIVDCNDTDGPELLGSCFFWYRILHHSGHVRVLGLSKSGVYQTCPRFAIGDNASRIRTRTNMKHGRTSRREDTREQGHK